MGSVTSLAEHVAQRKRARSVIPTTSETFDRAWAAFPEAGRKRSSKIESWPAWKRVIETVPEDELLASVVAFAADPAERGRECGPPGFHRWLKWGRWEHWLGHKLPEARPRRFIGEKMRVSFHARFADDRARDWFDRCYRADSLYTFVGSLEEPKPRQEWIDGPFAAWMRENGLRAFRWAR